MWVNIICFIYFNLRYIWYCAIWFNLYNINVRWLIVSYIQQLWAIDNYKKQKLSNNTTLNWIFFLNNRLGSKFSFSIHLYSNFTLSISNLWYFDTVCISRLLYFNFLLPSHRSHFTQRLYIFLCFCYLCTIWKLIQTHLSLSFSMYAWRANNKLYFWRCNTNMNVEIATLIKHKMYTERLLFLRNFDTSTIVLRSLLVRMMIWVFRIDHFMYILVRKNLVGTVYI